MINNLCADFQSLAPKRSHKAIYKAQYTQVLEGFEFPPLKQDYAVIGNVQMSGLRVEISISFKDCDSLPSPMEIQGSLHQQEFVKGFILVFDNAVCL